MLTLICRKKTINPRHLLSLEATNREKPRSWSLTSNVSESVGLLSEKHKVADLHEGLDGIDLKVRVIEAREPKVIQTRKGNRVISEAIVGDETGRIKLTLWGKQAGVLHDGEAIEIKGAWTTSYRGEVQLNIGSRGEISKIDEEEVPSPDEVPKNVPKAESKPGYQGFNRRQKGGYRKGGYRRE